MTTHPVDSPDDPTVRHGAAAPAGSDATVRHAAPTRYGAPSPGAYGAASPSAYGAPSPGAYGPPPGAYGPAPGGFGPPPAGFGNAWAPTAPAAPASLNALAVASVPAGLLLGPVGTVLGIVARVQIARRGGRGGGLAITGIVLGIVTTLAAVVTAVALTVGARPAPAPAPAPVVATPVPSASPSSSLPTTATGRAQLFMATMEMNAATNQVDAALDRDDNNSAALRADFADYQTAVQRYRSEATAAPTSGTLRSDVDAQLVPAIDQVLDDLHAISAATSRSEVQPAASRIDGDVNTMLATGRRLSVS